MSQASTPQTSAQPKQVTVTSTNPVTGNIEKKPAIIVTGSGASSGQQFVLTQNSKGTTFLQPTGGSGGQQYIITAVSNMPGAAGNQSGDHITPQAGSYSTIQYIDARGATPTSEQVVYTNGQGGNSMQYQEYTQTGYSPVSGSQYHGYSTGQQTITQLGLQGLGNQVVHQMGGHTYLIHGAGMDGEGSPFAHTTRAAPATVSVDNLGVQWLLDNYETAEGVSLPRCTLYNHYLRHCQEQKLDPMNPASFGKLIRSVFLGLRTRRLGTRGNSKYHYYGIRIKQNSPLNQLVPDDTPVALRQPTQPQKRFIKPQVLSESDSLTPKTEASSGGEIPSQQHRQFLGNPLEATIPEVELIVQPGSLSEMNSEVDLRIFDNLYKEHCGAILEVVVNLQFPMIENLWQLFWRKGPSLDQHVEAKLSKEKLYALCNVKEVQEYVKQMDYLFYQTLVEVLIPEVLRPIPSSLTQTIRNFAKNLESWLKAALTNVPEEMVKTKIGAISAFSQTLRRYTSLNHLAQAARAVLQNTSQIQQMLADLNRVDFANVQEQASWVCQCEDAVVEQMEQDFKKFLQEQHSLEEWSHWLEQVVDHVLKPFEGTDNFTKAARQFLLKWSFYSSMVIRDLTLRSAASFGSFHLIRLLYDEYMFYIVEHKVAVVTGETPIAVMGELMDAGDGHAFKSMKQEVLNPKRAFPAKAAMTVVTTSSSSPGTKTIVVVPVTSSSSDMPNNKKLKPS